MVGFFKQALAVACILGLAIAAPAPSSTPEVDYAAILITGKGLPTVEELGLTSEDLLKPAPALAALRERDITDKLFKRYVPQCWGDPKCWYNDALACYNYLASLGSTVCATSAITQMCRTSNCGWFARTATGGYVSSSCASVAAGGAWVLNNCNTNNWVAGTNAAYNNGNFGVDIYPN